MSPPMHYDGFIILTIVLIGLVPICRHKQWNWQVVQHSKVLNALFWCGWFGALVVGVLRIMGV